MNSLTFNNATERDLGYSMSCKIEQMVLTGTLHGDTAEKISNSTIFASRLAANVTQP